MGYIEENKKGRQRLQSIVGGLTGAELASQTGDGWTVAALLAHLAFWDYRAMHLLRRWKKEGVEQAPIDVDNINDAMKPLFLALPAGEAIRLVLEAAEGSDAEVESIPETMLPAIDEVIKEGKFRLNRALHRNEHLDQIEEVLAKVRER